MNFANGAQSSLTAPITAGATSLAVASAVPFPAAPFHIVVDVELMTVTAVVGTTFTVTRGIEFTTAVAHAVSAVVTLTVTAADFAGFGGSAGVSTFNTRSGAVVLTSTDVASVTAAGTAITLTNSGGTLTIANSGVASFNTRAGAVTLTSTDVNTVLAAGTNITLTNSGGFVTVAATGGGGGTVIPSQNDFRVTVQSGTPVPTADQIGASVVYLTPYSGGYIATYDATVWTYHLSAEISVTLAGLTSGKNYDIFCYFLSGTLKIDLGPTWNSGTGGSDTARGTGAGGTSLTTQDGVLVNAVSITSTINGDTIAAKAGRYVGTIRSTATTTTEDSNRQRFVYNVTNAVNRSLRRIDGTSSWNYNTDSWRIANSGSTSDGLPNQVNVVLGQPAYVEAGVFVSVKVPINGDATVSISEDSTTALTTGAFNGNFSDQGATFFAVATSTIKKTAAIGLHFYAWLERADTATTTWNNHADVNYNNSGINGFVVM